MPQDLTILLKDTDKPRLAAPKNAIGVPILSYRARITDRDKAEFCTQLSVMLKARVSLLHALEVLIRQTQKKSMKRVIESIAKEVKKGASLDHALSMHPAVFDRLFVVTAEVGQESGRLPEVLSHLAAHLEKMSALKRKFTQALAYPALVMTVAAVAVSFLLIFIIPTFAEMFQSFQIDLPFSTQVVLGLSHLLSQYGLWTLLAVALLAFLSKETLRRPEAKAKLENYSFRLPLLGDVFLKTHIARFCRTLGTLLEAQVSLVDALSVTQRIATNDGIRRQIATIIKHVRQGHAIADPLADSTLFPPMVVQMVAVGEETSDLDKMLLKVADYYEQEIDGKVETLSSVMEPVIVLFLGVMVAGVLIAMYLPMFDLVNVVGGG